MKKISFRVFLSLFLVVVLMLGTVGAVSAAKPEKIVSLEFLGFVNGDINNNIEYRVTWDNIGAWGFQIQYKKYELDGTYIKDLGTWVSEWPKRITTPTNLGGYVIGSFAHEGAGFLYTASIVLLKKNGNYVRNSLDIELFPFYS